MGAPKRWSDEIAKPKELEARWDECLSNVTALAKIKANAGDFKTKDEYVKYCADKANALFALKYGLDYGYEKNEISIMDFDPSKKYPKGSVVVVDDDMSRLEEKLDIPDFLIEDKPKEEQDG